MKKIFKEKNKNNEAWFSWLTGKFNSYEAFKEFSLGQQPEDVANKFISLNSLDIANIIDNFDEDDKHVLDQFHKLTECEWHVIRILKKKLEFKNKVKFVDFKKRRKDKNK